MTAARGRALLVAGLIALGLLASCNSNSQSPPADRPKLLLLTSLPIMFAESFSLQPPQSPVREALERRFQIVPISTSSASELAKGKLLLMAQPRAQRPQDLVALDQWVRGGGRVLLLADPLLEWPSERPLGDPLRPPLMFADTGLLAHWGLRLDAPDQRGPTVRMIGKDEVLTGSPGALFGEQCRVASDRLAAECRVGKGKAVIVADVDVLDLTDLDGPTENNVEAIVRILADLQWP